MNLDHRERLVKVARKFDALIVTDDVYDFLQWPSSFSTTQPYPSQAYVPRIVDIDR
jgi:DNA-binding transcriptional MocR family regulator